MYIYIYQGAVVGGIVGLIFPMWISIGAYVSEIQLNSLPVPTQNCSNYVPTSPQPVEEP